MDAVSVLEEYNNILSDRTAFAVLLVLAALVVVARQQEFRARTRMVLLSFMLFMAFLRTAPFIYEKTQSIMAVYAAGALTVIIIYTLHRHTTTAATKALDREFTDWKKQSNVKNARSHHGVDGAETSRHEAE
ncbi:MAG: hypothetical protein PHG85_00090 [Candidatus Altiarchaeota archaeon]|nr:hypothetical protein [Candidatus Altiarchaeota archaeon]